MTEEPAIHRKSVVPGMIAINPLSEITGLTPRQIRSWSPVLRNEPPDSADPLVHRWTPFDAYRFALVKEVLDVVERDLCRPVLLALWAALQDPHHVTPGSTIWVSFDPVAVWTHKQDVPRRGAILSIPTGPAEKKWRHAVAIAPRVVILP